MLLDAKIGAAVIAVIKVRIEAIDAPELLDEAIVLLGAESKDLPGFLAAQILLSTDSKTLVILSEWVDDHAWSQARYDVRVGKLTEHCHAKASSMEFELYKRRAEVPKSG